MVDCEKKSKTIEIDINSDDIGAFIGAKGSNYKRMISEFKKKILNKTTEITSEEWNSIQIKLQFDKKDDKIIATYKTENEYDKIIEEVINKYINIYKKENKKYENKKNQGIQLVFRIGAKHRFIGRMIGLSGINVNNLKDKIMSLDTIEKIVKITIEEQTKRFNGSFRNIGERNSDEHIMMFITLKGNPDFIKIQTIVESFVKEYTKDEEDEEEPFEGGW
jgi:hypothetical protein